MSARFQISAMDIARNEAMYVNVRKEAAAMQAFQMAASFIFRKHHIVHLIQVYI